MSLDAEARHAADSVRRQDIIEWARLLVETPSPAGFERVLAERLADRGERIAPGLRWHVDTFDGERANLIVTAGPAEYAALRVMLFAHLDTSLAGAHEYRRLNGRDPAIAAPDLQCRDGLLIGAGMAVAKGPVAAALSAVVAAHRCGSLRDGTGVLLTSGGTHRAAVAGDGFAAGLRRALDAGLAPECAVNVKAGAPGVLHAEPGSAYLRVTVRSAGGPLMLHDGDSCAGAAAALARLLQRLEAWRRELRGSDPAALCGRDIGMGALTAGLTDKPDMLASVSQADLYLITAPGDDAEELADELADYLNTDDGAPVTVEVTAAMSAGCTAPEHPVVELATQAWNDYFSPFEPVTGWRGSTDGSLLRHAGVPVARLGPRPRRAPAGLEALDIDELASFARIDAELLVNLGAR